MYNGVTNWRKNNVINKCITEVLFLCETPEQLYCYLLKIYVDLYWRDGGEDHSEPSPQKLLNLPTQWPSESYQNF